MCIMYIYSKIMQISVTQGDLNYFNILLDLLCSLAIKKFITVICVL